MQGLGGGLCLLSPQLLQTEAGLLVTDRLLDRQTVRQQADRKVVPKGADPV